MKLRNTSKRVSKRSKRRVDEDSPGRPGEEPEELSGETAVPGGVHTHQEGPRGDPSDVGGGTNAPSGDTGPGGHRGEEESSRGVEGESNCVKVVDRAERDGIRPSGARNNGGGDTKPPSRGRRSGGDLGERDELGDVEGDRERQSDGDGDDMDGR